MGIIQNDKFHTVVLATKFIKKYEETDSSYLTLMGLYLTRCNNKYKTIIDFTKYLDENYGLRPRFSLRFIGDYTTFTISLTAIHPKWIGDSKYDFNLIKDTFKLLYLNPLVNNFEFDQEILDYVKNEIYQDIDNYDYNKQLVASKRALSTYIGETNYRLFGECDKNIIQKITTKELYDYYLDFIKNDYRFYADGDVGNEFDEFNSKAPIIYKHKEFKDYNKEIPTIIEEGKLRQTYLRMIFGNAPIYSDEEAIAGLVANYYLGGASNSQLFMKIREELGLCYDISSVYYQDYGCFFISCGIEKEKISITTNEIKKVINELAEGNFTIDELEIIKHKFINSLKSGIDYRMHNINEKFLKEVFVNRSRTVEETILKIKNVQKEDIIEIFKKLKLNFVYALKGDDINE